MIASSNMHEDIEDVVAIHHDQLLYAIVIVQVDLSRMRLRENDVVLDAHYHLYRPTVGSQFRDRIHGVDFFIKSRA